MALLGTVLPSGAGFIWLAHFRASAAFWHIQRTLTLFHGSLGRRPAGYLLLHAFSPILPLLVGWLLLHFTGSQSTDSIQRMQGKTLLLGACLGLLAYILQGKGYPYHRYSLLAFLLTLIAVDLDRLIERQDSFRWIGATLIAVSTVLLGLMSARAISRLEWQDQAFRTTLCDDLRRLASPMPMQSLSGRIQCLDSIGGCVASLNYLQLVQNTGTLYDEFLFHLPQTPAVQETRDAFRRQIQANPPEAFIITAPLFPDGPDCYQKLLLWPMFGDWLGEHYFVVQERSFIRAAHHGGAAFQPPGYRIYVRREPLTPLATIPFR